MTRRRRGLRAGSDGGTGIQRGGGGFLGTQPTSRGTIFRPEWNLVQHCDCNCSNSYTLKNSALCKINVHLGGGLQQGGLLSIQCAILSELGHTENVSPKAPDIGNFVAVEHFAPLTTSCCCWGSLWARTSRHANRESTRWPGDSVPGRRLTTLQGVRLKGWRIWAGGEKGGWLSTEGNPPTLTPCGP